MSKIKGQNFRFLKDGSVFDEATNCSITLTGNAEDTSTKDTTGMFSKDTIVSTSWSAQVDTYQSTDAQLRAIISMFIAAAAVSVGWDETRGANNAVQQHASFEREGEALLTDVNMTFNDRETVQTSLQFTGTGPVSGQ